MINRQIAMAKDRATPLVSNQEQTGKTSMAKIKENESRINKSCNKYKPNTTREILIKTAAKRTGYAVNCGMIQIKSISNYVKFNNLVT